MHPLRYFFNFAARSARARCFGSDKFLDSVRFIVRSHLSGCVRCTCTSGKNIATMGKRGNNVRSVGAKLAELEKLQNTGNDGLASRIRLR